MPGITPNPGALVADPSDMGSIGSVNTSATQAAGATQAVAGLPPVQLAQAASTNTVNAQLVSSQWGIDPAAVGGVYGGAAESGGVFAGTALLSLLTTLSHATAEQALALIGVRAPTPGGARAAASATSATAAGTTATGTAASTAPQGQSTLAQASSRKLADGRGSAMGPLGLILRRSA